jgi:probable rRNA maturation factor
MTIQVDVQNACDDDTAPDNAIIASWVNRAVDGSGTTGVSEVSVRVVSAEEIRALNKRYRSKDKPTNVLSFPAGKVSGLPADIPVVLGDIVICASVVRDEAAAQRKVIEDHWAHMLVHGTLHLLGFDHESDSEAAEMEALETTILCDHGLADPYRAAGENC